MTEAVSDRPQTLREVAEQSDSLSEFGMNLRDWQHEIQRGGVHSRRELSRRIEEAPPLLGERIVEGDVADAYLAAYAEWLSDQAAVPRPAWCSDRRRTAQDPWFATPVRGWLLASAPASFRQRNIYALPEPIFRPAPGRPKVHDQQKREKARLRQQAYRDRIRTGARGQQQEPQIHAKIS